MGIARAVAVAATLGLLPTIVLASNSRLFVALAILEAAILASATAYAVYLGLYRFPR